MSAAYADSGAAAPSPAAAAPGHVSSAENR